MKNRHLSRLIVWSFFLTALIWFVGCKKNDDTTPAQTTIAGSYKINTLTIDPKALGLYSDLIAGSKLFFNNSTCLNDITITFNSNGTATTDNPSSCQSLPVAVSTFTGIDASSKWTQSGSILTVTKGDGTKTDYTIVSNTNGVMKLQWQGLFNYPAPSTTQYTYTMELKKQ